MWLNILYAFPELSLLVGIVHLCGAHLFTTETDKVYARIARFWLLVSLFFSIVFYDKSISSDYFANNAYTLVFKLPIYFFTYMILGVTPSWFAAEKKTSFMYNICLLSALIVINLSLAAINLWPLAISVLVISGINSYLLKIGSEKTSAEILSSKSVTSGVIMLLFLGGMTFLFVSAGGKLDYDNLSIVFEENKANLAFYLAACALLVPFLYVIGIAPFHFSTEDNIGKSVLPVSHYFATAFPLACWGVFIKLNIILLSSFAVYLQPVYILFAFLSIFLGAVGANARINLHRIYAFGSIYHFGIVLLLLSFFNQSADFSAYCYILIYFLGLNGTYLVFYHLKSRNEYLSTIESLSGMVEHKPYTTGILLISLFSLVGLPPLAGFLAQVDIVYQLINLGHPLYLVIIFMCLLLLAKVYLEIIKTAYFEQNIIAYDAENKSIRIFMVLNALCILSAAFNPFNWLEKFKDMFYVIFV